MSGPSGVRASTAALMRTPAVRDRSDRAGRSACGSGAARSTATSSAASLLGHRDVLGQVVRRAQQGGFVGLLDRDLGDDPPTEDDDRPVAGQLDLLELGGVEQHRGAGRREVADQFVDLLLGPDVDAAGRVEAQHRLDPAGHPAGDGHLLLVAARELADLRGGAGIDLELGDRRVDLRALGRHVDRPPRSGSRRYTAARRSRGSSAASGAPRPGPPARTRRRP